MSAAVAVDVQYPAGRAGVPSERSIKTWVKAALKNRRDRAQLVVRIVDAAEGTALNERYRGRKGPTNVLSFPYDGPDVLEPPLLGDIVICTPVVQREAAAQGKQAPAHWAHMVIHGVLHLLGYDHEAGADAAVMEAAEVDILSTLGFANPYDADRPMRRRAGR